jgi:1,4-dihydroxy-2-naphthoyl-CoA hydrolase
MKSIWFKPVTLVEVNHWAAHRLMTNLGIELVAIGDDYLHARMPVDERTIQPMGCLHGGATCVLAETVGSIAAHFCIDPQLKICVGLEINVNHIKSMRNGWVNAIARPLHLGQSTQIWDIQARNEQQALIAVSRLTIAVLNKRI